jgi:hypothetical protein
MRLLVSCLLCVSLRGEVLDRIAVALGRQIVTRSAIVEQARVAAFLNRQPVDESPQNLRRVAERMIEQSLLRKEMEATRFPLPEEGDTRTMLDKLRVARGESFAADLARYRIDEAAITRNLLLQLTMLRFVELRFRPGSTVSEGEIEAYYRDTYVPDWRRRKPGSPAPEIDDARDEVEQLLLDRKIDRALDAWIRDARSQTRVQFFEEAFQ